MLTVDLVRARVRDGRLVLQRLDRRGRERAEELGATLLAVAREQVGTTRDELREALRACEATASEQKLVLGLCKLIEDAATFAEADGDDAVALRREVFLRAAGVRAADAGDSPRVEAFDRDAVLGAIARERGLAVGAVEAALFADLRGAQPLLAVASEAPAALIERYERASVQAVLLRAVRVVADVECAPVAARALFHRLKFHRLLHQIERRERGYRITIDGPYSLFDAVTKYGLELALMLPVLEASDRLELEAEVRWGTQRRPLTFRHEARRPGAGAGGAPPAVVGEVQELMTAFVALGTPWRVAPADTVLDLPGLGLVVPDLVFSHPSLAEPVYLEVLGYWSRSAVWRRIELVQAGLPHRVVFAVSSRLRVSEELLSDSESASLLVFKGSVGARALQRKLDALRDG